MNGAEIREYESLKALIFRRVGIAYTSHFSAILSIYDYVKVAAKRQDPRVLKEQLPGFLKNPGS